MNTLVAYALLGLIAVYLLAGFLYAILIVLNRGGGVFSIPLNILIGPVWGPFKFYSMLKLIQKKRVYSDNPTKS